MKFQALHQRNLSNKKIKIFINAIFKKIKKNNNYQQKGVLITQANGRTVFIQRANL